MIKKRSIYQEYIRILNAYVPSNTASKYIQQKLAKLNGKIDKCTIVVGNFSGTD